MKIIVTGGAGFIGSHVCDALLRRGDSVVCVDNFNDYYDPKIKENNIKHNLGNPDFKLYKEDIRNIDNLRKIFQKEKPDKIIHIAARAGVRPSIEHPLLYQDVNVKGTLNLLELTKEFKIKYFVFASSSSVYGVNKKIPFSEKHNVDKPISFYAATKKSNELYAYVYHHLYGLNCTGLRFFTVYGPWGRPDMAMFKFIKSILANKSIDVYNYGKMKRDFTYISDVIQGVLAALDNPFPYEIFNLGNNKPVRLNKLIKIIEKLLGKKAKRKLMPIQPGDVPITYANISKAKKLLGYKPKTKIKEGVKNFIEWYQTYIS